MVDAGPAAYPVGVDGSGMIFWHERGTSADGSALSWSLKSADLIMDDNRDTMVRGMWPDIADQIGAITLTIYTREYPQGTVTTWPTRTIAPDASRVDFKAGGRLLAFMLSGSSSPSRARIGRPTFDVKSRGRK